MFVMVRQSEKALPYFSRRFANAHHRKHQRREELAGIGDGIGQANAPIHLAVYLPDRGSLLARPAVSFPLEDAPHIHPGLQGRPDAAAELREMFRSNPRLD
jgi:hypothetical protein